MNTTENARIEAYWGAFVRHDYDDYSVFWAISQWRGSITQVVHGSLRYCVLMRSCIIEGGIEIYCN